MPSFEQIWEVEARWTTGPYLLSSIINFLRDKSLVAEIDQFNGSRINFGIPLPLVRNEINGDMISIFVIVPEKLRHIFQKKFFDISYSRLEDAEEINSKYCGLKNDPHTLDSINHHLALKERERRFIGKNELWEVAAREFGFNPYMLPRPLYELSA